MCVQDKSLKEELYGVISMTTTYIEERENKLKNMVETAKRDALEYKELAETAEKKVVDLTERAETAEKMVVDLTERLRQLGIC